MNVGELMDILSMFDRDLSLYVAIDVQCAETFNLDIEVVKQADSKGYVKIMTYDCEE